MPVNPSTATTIAAGVGAGLYGVVRWTRARREGEQLEDASEVTEKVPFSRSMVGQTACATMAGWFQVYSGGIAIDTVATRLQAGLSPSQALYGVEKMPSQLTISLRYQMLRRSNLFAGHFVTMLSRFPYLCLNFNSYAQTEQLLLHHYGGDLNRMKTFKEEFACVTVATIVSSTAICAAECPKILDQLKGVKSNSGRETVYGVLSKFGPRRLMQGYTACFCREFLFNIALLGSPSLALRLRNDYVLPNRESSTLAHYLDGKEGLCSSLGLGMSFGFITNAPDQMKTNIQKGQFLNMREAVAWQLQQPGGLFSLFGRAAVWRASFIAQAVVAINFARSHVEGWINAVENLEEGESYMNIFVPPRSVPSS